MRILLVRHAESEGNIDEKMYIKKGDQNISITEKGCQQALANGKFLANYYARTETTEWPEIFLSSYQRPQETFRGMYEGGLKNHFSEQDDPKLKEDFRLIEKFFGAASALHFPPENIPPELAEALLTLSGHVYRGDPFSSKHLYGESSLETAVRVRNFIDGTLARDIAEGKNDFLIVTHGAIAQAFIMNWFHLPMRSKGQLGNPNNCDIIEISGEPKNWSVRRIYDGETMQPDNTDLIAGINRLTIDRVPSLPYPQA